MIRQRPSGTQPSGRKEKDSRKKVGGKKDSGKASAEASGEGAADASEFSFTNFVQAAAKSMKKKREYLLSLADIS